MAGGTEMVGELVAGHTGFLHRLHRIATIPILRFCPLETADVGKWNTPAMGFLVDGYPLKELMQAHLKVRLAEVGSHLLLVGLDRAFWGLINTGLAHEHQNNSP